MLNKSNAAELDEVLSCDGLQGPVTPLKIAHISLEV